MLPVRDEKRIEFVGSGATLPWGDEIWRDELGLVIYRDGGAASDRYVLTCNGKMAVAVWPDDRRIVAPAATDHVPQVTIDHFVADQVAPRLLAHRGGFVLHAGGSCVDDGAILFVGSSGAGKSTLTASFDQRGYALIGDDALVVSVTDGQPFVEPVYPSLRLLPDSLKALFPAGHPSSEVAHYGSKRRLEVPVRTGIFASLPVAAIFLLGEPTDSRTQIRPARPADCCMALVANSFALDPAEPRGAERRLSIASQLANQLPCFHLRYPHRYDALAQVHGAILEQVEAIMHGSSKGP